MADGARGDEITAVWARFGSQLTYDDLPDDVRATVRRLALDTFATTLAANTLGVGIPQLLAWDDPAIEFDGVLAFENLDDDGPGGHEGAEVIEERPFVVLGIEALRLLPRQPDAFLGYDPEPRLLQPGSDFPR